MLAHGFVWSKERLAFSFHEELAQGPRSLSRAAEAARESTRLQQLARRLP